MKQTAVEWLQEALEQTILTHEQEMQTIGLFHQAKTMEKEQIIDSYSYGWHDGQEVIVCQVKYIDKGGDDAGKQYYNETFKSE